MIFKALRATSVTENCATILEDMCTAGTTRVDTDDHVLEVVVLRGAKQRKGGRFPKIIQGNNSDFFSNAQLQLQRRNKTDGERLPDLGFQKDGTQLTTVDEESLNINKAKIQIMTDVATTDKCQQTGQKQWKHLTLAYPDQTMRRKTEQDMKLDTN